MRIFDEETVFRNRKEAGRRLAGLLERYRDAHPIVLGLPRGGVVLAYEVAKALHAPLDVMVVRKIGDPAQPELAIGAIAPEGVLLLQHQPGIPQKEIDKVIAREKEEMERRIRLYRGERAMPDVTGRTVILVDDGLATGATALAAVRVLRKKNPKRLVLAAGVCTEDALSLFESEVDDMQCASVPELMVAIGTCYVDFQPVSDQEVLRLLEDARRQENGADV